MRQNDASHQTGNGMKPMKNSQAWMGEVSSSSDRNRSDHGVGCTRGGRRGSLMWYVLERPSEGGCAAMIAPTGMDESD